MAYQHHIHRLPNMHYLGITLCLKPDAFLEQYSILKSSNSPRLLICIKLFC